MDIVRAFVTGAAIGSLLALPQCIYLVWKHWPKRAAASASDRKESGEGS